MPHSKKDSPQEGNNPFSRLPLSLNFLAAFLQLQQGFFENISCLCKDMVSGNIHYNENILCAQCSLKVDPHNVAGRIFMEEGRAGHGAIITQR